MNSPELAALCPALKELLEHELARGNRVDAAETGWSKVDLAVRLSGPLDMLFVKRAAKTNRDLEIWESGDVKNPQERGVLCKSARQSLSGSLAEPKNSPKG